MTTLARSETPFVSTLAGHYYYDPEIYALEQERIFAQMWVCVGRAEAISGPGAYQVVTIIGEQLNESIIERFGDYAAFARYNVGNIKVGKTIVYNVQANWKLIIENFISRYFGNLRHCAPTFDGIPRLIESARREMFPFLPTQSNEALAQIEDERVFGWDPLPGIVSVWANREGRAVVWQRLEGRVTFTTEHFRPWLFATTLEILPIWERPCCLLLHPVGISRRLAIANWMGLKALIVICFPLAMDGRLNDCC